MQILGYVCQFPAHKPTTKKYELWFVAPWLFIMPMALLFLVVLLYYLFQMWAGPPISLTRSTCRSSLPWRIRFPWLARQWIQLDVSLQWKGPSHCSAPLHPINYWHCWGQWVCRICILSCQHLHFFLWLMSCSSSRMPLIQLNLWCCQVHQPQLEPSVGLFKLSSMGQSLYGLLWIKLQHDIIACFMKTFATSHAPHIVCRHMRNDLTSHLARVVKVVPIKMISLHFFHLYPKRAW